MKKTVMTSIFVMVSTVLFAQSLNSAYSKMYDSIIANDLESLSSLIEKTEDINLVENDGHHVFESIFVMSNCDAAELLLKAGMDLSYKNKDGLTLKELILETKNKKLISFLYKYKQ